jgi:hypothetical protein
VPSKQNLEAESRNYVGMVRANGIEIALEIGILIRIMSKSGKQRVKFGAKNLIE